MTLPNFSLPLVPDARRPGENGHIRVTGFQLVSVATLPAQGAEDQLVLLTSDPTTMYRWWSGAWVAIKSPAVYAHDVLIADAGGWFPGATNVEDALQQLGAGTAGQLRGAIPINVLTALDSVPTISYSSVDWELILSNGSLRYKSSVHAVTNGSSADGVEDSIVVGPGLVTLPLTIDVAVIAGNLSLTVLTTSPGWAYRVRRLALSA